ncbi:helix-turn-helix domain-containing protein [Ruminococcus sp.]|jgi:DNA-binding XRE family transcriptional regulator|uniref:helix-turn-helix transcriptional regulator n=1 Tax=Ruminococcus sp. TaxID=41978 RepID=UPI0025D121B8|nr:helix-turn-helix domain-containing protein [Ruminococcus sp.]
MDNRIKAMQIYLLLIRKVAGLTSAEFGDRIGVTRQTVNNIESGRSVLTKTQYCAICHVLTEEFYNSDGDALMFMLLFVLLVINGDRIDNTDAEAMIKSAQIMASSIISKEATRKDVSNAWVNANMSILIKYYDFIADTFKVSFNKLEKYQSQLQNYLGYFSEGCIKSAESDIKNSIINKISGSFKDLIQNTYIESLASELSFLKSCDDLIPERTDTDSFYDLYQNYIRKKNESLDSGEKSGSYSNNSDKNAIMQKEVRNNE